MQSSKVEDQLIRLYLQLENVMQKAYDDEHIKYEQAKQTAKGIMDLFTEMKGGISNPGVPRRTNSTERREIEALFWADT